MEKWSSEEALQIAEKRREVKGKGERERYSQLNAENSKDFLKSSFKWTMQRNKGTQ